eukprot:TRINITY_DN38452_c0_g1_i1.p1 TRINITY_DN38452_c0_g1~~TRINITY_DN38452_c0_g1_i1.p1  ORF type:complete len:238 (+),score=39.87 TRINITY_DN38452_c0_g1_i1:47-760(+)
MGMLQSTQEQAADESTHSSPGSSSSSSSSSRGAAVACSSSSPSGGSVDRESRCLRVRGAILYHGSGRFEDDRGFYEEIDLVERALEDPFLCRQSGYAMSRRNVLRGIHCSAYGKVVVCLAGEMWDVVVDLREESETYLMWDTVTLSPERRSRLYVPPGVGHGYLSLRDGTVTLYLKTGLYDRSSEKEANPFDPMFAIRWPRPLDGADDYIMSAKDRSLPMMSSTSGPSRGGERRSKL